MENKRSRLSEMSQFTFGTTRMGDDSITVDERIAVARAAMDAGLWFHTSHSYGSALEVLRKAFDQDRAHVPSTIFKIGWDSIPQIRETIQQNGGPLAVNSMAVGQLCLGGAIAEEFRTGGACYSGFQQMREEGLVDRFVVELWPWNSAGPLQALEQGYGKDIIDGLIFYFNPLQRFVSNELWDHIVANKTPVVAMRTVCGGSVTRLKNDLLAPTYLRNRAIQVAPIFEKSGRSSWTQFCIDFACSFPQVASSVGSTAHVENLHTYLNAVANSSPLPTDIVDELLVLQREWYVEHDSKAEPWSM